MTINSDFLSRKKLFFRYQLQIFQATESEKFSDQDNSATGVVSNVEDVEFDDNFDCHTDNEKNLYRDHLNEEVVSNWYFIFSIS